MKASLPRKDAFAACYGSSFATDHGDPPLPGQRKVIVDKLHDKTAEFDAPGRVQTIAAAIEASEVAERWGQAGLEDFLAGKGAPAGVQEAPQQETIEEKGTDGMAKVKKAKVNKKRATKGRKAAAATNGHMDKIFDYSVCAVLRKLGNEGVTVPHATSILKARGITMPASSLAVQVGLGRTEKRPIAPLTKEQVKELKDSADEPKPETATAA